jgi:transposase-like protein
MKRKRYSDEQVAFALRQAENGTLVEVVCRKLGVFEATFYRWKKQLDLPRFGGEASGHSALVFSN